MLSLFLFSNKVLQKNQNTYLCSGKIMDYLKFSMEKSRDKRTILINNIIGNSKYKYICNKKLNNIIGSELWVLSPWAFRLWKHLIYLSDHQDCVASFFCMWDKNKNLGSH